MKKLILIGSMGRNGIVYDGETMKNHLFYIRFSKLFDDIVTINTTDWKKKPYILIKLVWVLIFSKKETPVVISACDVSAYHVIRFLYYFRVKKKVIFWVVGGGFHNRIANKELYPKYYMYLTQIIVQDPLMVKSLKQSGLMNVSYMPNSKPIYPIDAHSINTRIRFIYLSRILPEKGCDLIVSCAQRLNQENLPFEIVFYGGLSDYPDFADKLDALENVSYGGLLNLTNVDGYIKLAQGDVFLFPTYYPNEGFPGVLIDAMIAGLPPIVTEWNYNTSIISDKLGYIITPNNELSLFKAMKKCIEHPEDIVDKQKRCFNEAKKYDISFQLSDNILKRVGLID